MFFLEKLGITKGKPLFFLAEVVFFLIVLFFLTPLVWGFYSVAPRTYLGQVSLKGKSSELRGKIEKECNNYQNQTTKFNLDGKVFSAKLSDIGFQIDHQKTYKNFENNFLNKKMSFGYFLRWWTNLFLGFKVPVFYSFEEKELEKYLENNFKIKLFSPREATFSFESNSINVVPSEKGIGVDSMFFVAQVLDNLKKWENNPIKIQIVEVDPEISTSQAEEMKIKLEKIFDYPFSFKARDYDFNIPKNIILSWLEIQKDQRSTFFSLDRKTGDLKEMINLIATGQNFSDYKKKYELDWNINKISVESFLKKEVESLIYRKAENGILAFEGGGIIEKKASVPETTVDIAKSVEMITEALKNNQYFITLPVKETAAGISLSKIKELGIDNLLAVGESNFIGSPNNRKHNIRVGAGKFNGTVIEKDAEFSFIETLGPVDKENGYLPELVIKKDKTIPEYGGGMCQVSSTAFRGAVKSGLRVTERQNHAYPVQYYSPQGTDATVYVPKPDLKFVNNTPGPILIQTRMEGNNLYFDFFGRSDGRRVELEGPRTWDKKADGSMKAEWIQKVFSEKGDLLFQKNFLSKYESPSKFPHPGDEKPPVEKKKKKKGGT